MKVFLVVFLFFGAALAMDPDGEDGMSFGFGTTDPDGGRRPVSPGSMDTDEDDPGTSEGYTKKELRDVINAYPEILQRFAELDHTFEKIQGVEDPDDPRTRVLLVGDTGAGKSTLLHVLMEKDLLVEAQKNWRGAPMGTYYLTPTEGQRLSEVRAGRKSCTSHPIVIDCPERNLTFIDCPGFFDNRFEMRPHQELLTGILLRYIMEKGYPHNRLKLLFVTQQAALESRAEDQSFVRLQEWIGKDDLVRQFNGIGVVITHYAAWQGQEEPRDFFLNASYDLEAETFTKFKGYAERISDEGSPKRVFAFRKPTEADYEAQKTFENPIDDWDGLFQFLMNVPISDFKPNPSYLPKVENILMKFNQQAVELLELKVNGFLFTVERRLSDMRNEHAQDGSASEYIERWYRWAGKKKEDSNALKENVDLNHLTLESVSALFDFNLNPNPNPNDGNNNVFPETLDDLVSDEMGDDAENKLTDLRRRLGDIVPVWHLLAESGSEIFKGFDKDKMAEYFKEFEEKLNNIKEATDEEELVSINTQATLREAETDRVIAQTEDTGVWRALRAAVAVPLRFMLAVGEPIAQYGGRVVDVTWRVIRVARGFLEVVDAVRGMFPQG